MKLTLLPLVAAIVVISAVTASLAGCGRNASATSDSTTTDSAHIRIPLPDTLRVATLYSPTSYFLYRDETMGYDYELLSKFIADKHLALSLEIAPSLAAAVELLDSGRVDMIAYDVPVTAEYREHVIPCGVEDITTQVLVQPRGKNRVEDVTQLVGRDVYVEKDSKYYHRMLNLNDELGGGVNIHSVNRDTLITEDLIEMVSEGKIPLTVVDSDIARLNKTYYPSLDITLEVSYPQRAAWGVAPSKPWLADSINSWVASAELKEAKAELLKRYFELSKNEPGSTLPKIDFSKGRISPFDHLFRRHAATIHWDWRLIAAQGYAESKFDSTVVSWAGARGIMQIMPRTARSFGLSADKVACVEPSIATAVKIIKALDATFASKVPDPEERKKFIIAAYNSGPAHILDAIALAAKYGKNPAVWDGNVAEATLWKTRPEYYNDPVCRYGYFRGRQTYDYVNRVYSFYHQASAKIPR